MRLTNPKSAFLLIALLAVISGAAVTLMGVMYANGYREAGGMAYAAAELPLIGIMAVIGFYSGEGSG